MARRKRRNRKKQDQGMSFPAPLALVLVVGALTALSYLWLCGRCEDLGERIKKLEARRAELERKVIHEEYKLSNMKSPRNIEHLLRVHGLDMEWPGEEHVYRLPMSAVRGIDEATLPQAPQYAQWFNGVRHD